MMKYFSLFTGIGGLDMGLEEMGYKCAGFSEIKETSISIYKRHYPEHNNFGDITKIDVKKLPDFDILTGGFPCQSFSMAGLRKGFEDKRGKMIFYIYDILKEKKPKFAVLENVKGILTHNNGETYRNVFLLLQSAGYFVRVVLLNSLNYGSVQNRERIIFLCSRVDFEKKNPIIIDNNKLFRDIRDNDSEYDYLSKKMVERIETGNLKGFITIGGYDRINTLMTAMSRSDRKRIIVQENNGKWRYLTCLEGERLQGFPDNWTIGEKKSARWFAIGNAVNCNVSRYLFNNYLKGLWF